MKLKKVQIKNFRRLQDISFSLEKNLSVIVGPNAIGKSTIFEAIRLAKAIMFPRAQDELRNVLIQLGATSAHYFNGQLQYDISNLARDVERNITIILAMQFSEEELQFIKANRQAISYRYASSQLGRSSEDPNFDLRSYFSTDLGKTSVENAGATIDQLLADLSPQSLIEFRVDINAQQISISNPVLNIFVTHLEGRLTPEKALFSYFPADRSLPQGEVAIQIGPQDYKVQSDSHLAHATAKYGRLKQTVVNQTVLARVTDIDLKPQFDSIFDTFLPGKEFVGLAQKLTGLLAVLIRDKESGKIFDIDSLSSGEKGLVLSFLLFNTSLSIGSIVLVDELELHLNPAVSRKIIPYLADHVISRSDCQFIISTHSAEILRDAYERDDAHLFHLRNEKDISPVLPQDKKEVLEAIRRLGASTESALTSKALVFVEGDSDIDIFTAAFPSLITSVQLQALNGRTEVEKSIRELLKAEKDGTLKERQGFLFDLDRRPSNLVGTNLVRIEQLNRYCVENYLLDEELLFDLIVKHSTRPPTSRGEFTSQLKEAALEQLDAVCLTSIMEEYRALRASLATAEIKSRSIADIAALQLQRLKDLSMKATELLAVSDWETAFVTRHSEAKALLAPKWEYDWKKLCSGKQLLESLQRKYQINIDLSKLKVELAEKLGQKGSDDILALRSIFEKLLP
ncbi:AAA family ATPase [Herbaspirillum sp.]|uniref:ATP-dependent nuclease n=1 Tax=Herbaspirillum sp. TaxID=1890675 RepID=UPI000C0B4469|nr:AAA family ATPase [Herbaspirillum sp.]MAF05650.1 recombinase RecF [Herbaspirillum sp.]MBO16689.1 recombinase RecF [Herbaspirillum sp.]